MNIKKPLKKIPESKMMAGWNVDVESRIIQLVILSSEEISADDYDKYDWWEGKDSKDWANGDFRTSALGLYAYLAAEYGFQTRNIAYDVLKQFSKVKGQTWAKLTRDSMDGKLL